MSGPKVPRVIWQEGSLRVVDAPGRTAVLEKRHDDAMGVSSWTSIASGYGGDTVAHALAKALVHEHRTRESLQAELAQMQEAAGMCGACKTTPCTCSCSTCGSGACDGKHEALLDRGLCPKETP